jgi:class 3 adenylate cyclase/tetratricopeptide (TPR) repeat protein
MAVSRRTVTVLFADVADSTPLGERLDPEALRQVMSRYFETARTALERHGGTVEKFIGDAVMAVFGVPELHEDDAVRAVKAAAELRAGVDRLSEKLERERGVQIRIRIGVNTGEVVAGDGRAGHGLVTGDAVNVAKRLEEAARAGEVLVGASTEWLARAAASFEPVAPLDLKGKSAPVEAWRIVDVTAVGGAFERRLDTPLVGRRAELARLRSAFEHAVAERVCHRFTLLGSAGIGKSRLACELFAEVAPTATVVSGRCLPYGDGITFWPLHEVIREVGGDEGVVRLLGGGAEADLVCQRLTGGGSGQETFWAVRRLCEALARARPLVLCLEDVHWAEPTFLDLVEYLTGWIRDAPILLLCLARPEFVDQRPAWVADGAFLTLSPLRPHETEELLDLLGADTAARARIAEAAEGNPLYVEQMAAMVAEGGYANGAFTMPPTIHALLAARLDRLPPSERAALERAAVAGKEFARTAIVELTPAEERDDLGADLMSLVRKDFVRPHRIASLADDAFRFAHVLVRDAAYAAIPKETRAQLHARFADWLEESARAPDTEFEEIIGYHLEQAYRYREQLGPLDDGARVLASRAGDLLGRAGRRAFARDDIPAAVNLLDRAVSLATAQEPAHVELRRELALALWSLGEIARAEALLDGVIEAAGAIGDERVEWYALLDRAGRKPLTDPDATDQEAFEVARRALEVFERLGDDRGTAQAWREISQYHQSQGRFGVAGEAAARALQRARRVGDGRLEPRCADSWCTCLLYGPAPTVRGIAVCEELLRGTTGKPLLEANVRASLAGLEGMRGAFDTAREHAARAEEIYGELGLRLAEAGLRQIAAGVELLAGKPLRAEHALHPAFEFLEGVGAHGYTGVLLAEALYAQGRRAETVRLLDAVEPAVQMREVAPQSLFRSLRARLAARGGDEDAIHLASSAVELAHTTDALNLQGDALAALAEVFAILGRPADGARALAEAIAVYEQKGNAVAVERARTLLPTTAAR